MRNRSPTSSTRFALTLVEVVAGIALLSTVLVAVITAHSKHALQIKRAQARLNATEQLDLLLAEWSAAGAWQPVGSEGENWRVVATGKRTPEKIPCEIIRVEIFDRLTFEVLSSVELLSESPWPALDSPL